MTTVLDELARLRQDAAGVPASPARFDGGGHYRVEIPSVESIEAFERVVAEADRRGVPVHRVSQGSGIMLLDDGELAEYARLGAERDIEVCLFVGPRAAWDGASPSRLTPEGAALGARNVGLASLEGALTDVYRAAAAGIRSVLVADEGLLTLIGRAKERGELPADLAVKASALLGIANPYMAAGLAALGADSLNIPAETTLAELAGYRLVTDAVLDLYIEAPDSLGGFLRYHEIGRIIEVASPVHVKFGLRNVAAMYPTGAHLRGMTVDTAVERVRRAAIGLEHLARFGAAVQMDPIRPRAGIPVGGPAA